MNDENLNDENSEAENETHGRVRDEAPEPEAPEPATLDLKVSELTSEVALLRERLELLPGQIRQLGAKVDDATESVSHPRVRDLLSSLILLHDLIEQMERSSEVESEGAAGGPDNYRVLRDQVAQILRLNGVQVIAESERFDPALHKAVEAVAGETPEQDGEVVCLYRTGFRTERSVLRYAEVVVRSYPAGATHEEGEP